MTATVRRSHLIAIVSLIFGSIGGDVIAGPKAIAEIVTQASSAATVDSRMQPSGEELWSNNCLRCHNIRPATMYGNAQWNVIVHHMRVRANITGQEQRAIAEFLKSSQ